VVNFVFVGYVFVLGPFSGFGWYKVKLIIRFFTEFGYSTNRSKSFIPCWTMFALGEEKESKLNYVRASCDVKVTNVSKRSRIWLREHSQVEHINKRQRNGRSIEFQSLPMRASSRTMARPSKVAKLRNITFWQHIWLRFIIWFLAPFAPPTTFWEPDPESVASNSDELDTIAYCYIPCESISPRQCVCPLPVRKIIGTLNREWLVDNKRSQRRWICSLTMM
jgi:hypothetical protein